MCGVAQGTVLGPVIFPALTNIALQDEVNHWKYVDNMTLIQRWTLRLPCPLQQTLNGLVDVVEKHKMKLNANQC